MKKEDIKVGLVFKIKHEDDVEGVVIHNRKFKGDVCILWNTDNDLYKSMFSYDEDYIIDMIDNGVWEIVK